MTLPANIRVNLAVPFPTNVQGAAPITIGKQSGNWIVGFDYSGVNIQIPAVPSYATDYILAFDSVTRQYFQVSLASISTAAANNLYRLVTAAGDVTILPGDQTILLNKSSGAPTNIILPPSGNRGGMPVMVKDMRGDANTNNITFVPSAGETIDGFSAAVAAANGAALIDINYGRKAVFPLTSGGWYV